ncbi:hypothetical protein H7F51_13750 [Novosphingobium flavum]|uniref:Uncharacterized protein n=1 Tax=Novosphingobium flavum TaxID=1778672 RepID=A0A7X1KMP7_9SPHN|nr:hypothetical protein [Novosphingobium flavum]MBC2666583.1 hypothetical protein [Novosphingobium flavum]
MPNETIDSIAAGGIGNLAFYRMCAECGTHDNIQHVRDKLVFISRVYSVSRGLGGQWDALACAMVDRFAKLGELIETAQRTFFPTSLKAACEAHAFLDHLTCTQLINSGISASGRASFASKYLHFHAPDAFPILDTVASRGLRSLTPGFRTGMQKPAPYPRFCERLAHYMAVNGKQGTSLRHIDQELLAAGRP